LKSYNLLIAIILYSSKYEDTSIAERQQNHFKIFGFNCECEACVNDYPMAKELSQTMTDGALCFKLMAIECKPFGTPEEVLTEFRDNCKLIEKFAKRKPCIESSLLTIRNKSIMTKLMTASPFGKSAK